MYFRNFSENFSSNFSKGSQRKPSIGLFSDVSMIFFRNSSKVFLEKSLHWMIWEFYGFLKKNILQRLAQKFSKDIGLAFFYRDFIRNSSREDSFRNFTTNSFKKYLHGLLHKFLNISIPSIIPLDIFSGTHSGISSRYLFRICPNDCLINRFGNFLKIFQKILQNLI